MPIVHGEISSSMAMRRGDYIIIFENGTRCITLIEVKRKLSIKRESHYLYLSPKKLNTPAHSS